MRKKMNESTKIIHAMNFCKVFFNFHIGQTLIFPQLNHEILSRYPSVGIYTNFEVAMLKKALI